MPISQEELRQPVLSTTLVPLFHEGDPNVFAVMMRFPTGKNGVWTLNAPNHAIDDVWIKHTLEVLLERIIEDLRDGSVERGVKADRKAFQMTNWESVTGALQAMLVEWEKKRRQWFNAMAAPLGKQ
jgi:hypothetical protein